MEKFIDRRL